MNLREWFRRFRALGRNAADDRDLDAGLAAHIELATEENTRNGMAPADVAGWP